MVPCQVTSGKKRRSSAISAPGTAGIGTLGGRTARAMASDGSPARAVREEAKVPAGFPLAGVLVRLAALRLNGPLGRLVGAGLLLLLRVLLVRLNDAGGVMRGRVDGVEPQGLVPCVDDVVPGAGGNLDRPAVRDVLLEVEIVLLGAHDGAALSGVDPEELVRPRMRLEPDALAGRDAHERDLEKLARPRDHSVVVVLHRGGLDV